MKTQHKPVLISFDLHQEKIDTVTKPSSKNVVDQMLHDQSTKNYVVLGRGNRNGGIVLWAEPGLVNFKCNNFGPHITHALRF